MQVERIKDLLDHRHVPYKVILHPVTFTAQQTAQATHIKGREMAKTVIVDLDGRHTMVVVPAHHHVDLDQLRALSGAMRAKLVDERDFRESFPDCEVGAMPPLGSLYDMDVYVDEELSADEEIAFNAGTHTEVIQMSYHDFEDLEHPRVGRLAEV